MGVAFPHARHQDGDFSEGDGAVFAGERSSRADVDDFTVFGDDGLRGKGSAFAGDELMGEDAGDVGLVGFFVGRQGSGTGRFSSGCLRGHD